MTAGPGGQGGTAAGEAVRVEDLAKDHAGERALKGLSFSVPAGCLFGIIGADGAGKSTLMSILATLIDPDAGSARVLGRDLFGEFPALRRDIGYMPQRFSLYPDLSVEENLDFFADLFGLPRSEKRARMESLLAFASLGPFRGRRAGALSGGMKQKLALACTLIHRPRLLLLDEPTVGVDPVARRDFWVLLKTLRDEGITLLVSTPYMDEAALCDRLLLLHGGRILAEGAPDDLLAGYPYRLYRVEGRGTSGPGRVEAPLHFPADLPPPGGLALLYPAAGFLHAAVPGGPAVPGGSATPRDLLPDPGGLLSSLREAVPGVETLRSIEPTIEDLFFALLSRADSGAQASPQGGRP